MHRSLIVPLLVTLTALPVNAADLPAAAQASEDLEKISEFNRAYWRWRRCVYKHEEVHGPSQDGKPPQICGPEPRVPKG